MDAVHHRQWGELRSILHTTRELVPLLRLLSQWPCLPEDDPALLDYLKPHTNMWSWSKTEVPDFVMMNHWLRGQFIFLLDLCSPNASRCAFDGAQLLDLELFLPEEDYLVSCVWFYDVLDDFVAAYTWLKHHANHVQVIPSVDNGSSDVLTRLRHAQADGDMPVTLDECHEVDVDMQQWQLGPNLPIIPNVDVEITAQSLYLWVQNIDDITAAHWFSMLEMFWRIDQTMPNPLQALYFSNTTRALMENETLLDDVWSLYCQIRCAALREDKL